MRLKSLFDNIRYDLPASIVVFFVAMPLCLGIALASGAPLFAGIIAGIVGGVVVGMASGSPLGVSGPAAGLAVIVATAITALGSWEVFLLAVVVAGLIQITMGYLRLGIIAYYFPTSVIKGMLTGIGLIIILKQIPHALGYDRDYEGDLSFQSGSENTFSALSHAIQLVNPGVIIISVISLLLLIIWEAFLTKKHRIFQIIQGPVAVVIVGIGLNMLFQSGVLPFSLERSQLVNIPIAGSFREFFAQFSLPDFSHLLNYQVYMTGVVLALVASLETLLCVEATDKLDPFKRVTPTNRELKAQGLGNIISGFIGGLPITQVIVRSSTNITFGGRTKLSTIIHGCFLLISAITIPHLLNMIPLATLACILFVVGYKLAKPSLFKAMYQLGWTQFVPFMATVVGIVFTDLLKGIAIGMAVAIFYILRAHYRNPHEFQRTVLDGVTVFRISLAEEVSFLNKGSILQTLNEVPEHARVIIDATKTKVLDHDVIEVIRDFSINAGNRNIKVEINGIPSLAEGNRYHQLTEKYAARDEHQPDTVRS